MYWPHAGHDIIGFSNVSAGDVLTFGAVMVRNSGDGPVVLRSVELDGGDASVAKSTTALTAGSDRTIGGVATGRGDFPPVTDFGVPLRSLDGSVVAQDSVPGSEHGTELLLRVEVTKAQAVTFTGVKIVYEYHGRTYTYVDPLGLQLCPQACL